MGGKYEIRRVLGAGGMGVVCEAVHQDLGKKVAVKLIDKSMKESELIVARFKREARALGQIQSEHIVDVFDVGADKRVGLYIVMEHLVGEDLQRRLDREKRVDVRTGVMIAHQLSRGLAKAHEAGVVHRDLKPANVFLTTRDNGQMLVKILDFGVSKMLGETGASRITGSGAPIGTPLYMSPEQAEGKDDTDGRADIWSLGAVMYEALSGNTPFNDRGSYHATIVGILTSRPKLMFDAAPHVPKDICSVIDACLVHDRDARIKDAAAFTQRLLEAYPAVMPDGTGRHTAVIIPQANAAVDATGDTEFFTSASIPAASASSRPSRPSKPDSRPASSGPNPISGADALRTAAATPVNLGDRASASPTPVELATYGSFAVSGENASIRTGGPKTEPLWKSPNSSASGVAMPGTPPIIEPLPMSVGARYHARHLARDEGGASSMDRVRCCRGRHHRRGARRLLARASFVESASRRRAAARPDGDAFRRDPAAASERRRGAAQSRRASCPVCDRRCDRRTAETEAAHREAEARCRRADRAEARGRRSARAQDRRSDRVTC